MKQIMKTKFRRTEPKTGLREMVADAKLFINWKTLFLFIDGYQDHGEMDVGNGEQFEEDSTFPAT